MKGKNPISESTRTLIENTFVDTQWAEVREILSSYGLETYENEVDRVRNNIIILSRGDLSELRHYTDCAKKDYRDVIYWAEYFEKEKDK